MALAAEVLRYRATCKGMLTNSASLAAASVKVLEESATPDVQRSTPPQLHVSGNKLVNAGVCALIVVLPLAYDVVR